MKPQKSWKNWLDLLSLVITLGCLLALGTADTESPRQTPQGRFAAEVAPEVHASGVAR